ncbi:Hypothetical predicted protein [Lynx pardinus]|uniref:Membrane-spanning 4-domains n=1 Tax=Lynx pardinus TaxID=191816 RepID=A0A485NBJ0_LYNPA|nr:Hypothetical predicted protein [Lynx pardinus]
MSAAPASNGVFVVIPPSDAGGLRPPPAILPSPLCQPPGVMQFEEPPLGAQTPRATQPPDLRPTETETFLTGEPKALGTVQILIGLIHLGFGGVLLVVRRGPVGMLFIEGGVPFWGGACFVISGSLSVAAEKNHTSCLVSLNGGPRATAGSSPLCPSRPFTHSTNIPWGPAECPVPEDSQTARTQDRRNQANTLSTYNTGQQPVLFLPNAFSADFNIPSPAASPPPAYDNVAYVPKESSE